MNKTKPPDGGLFQGMIETRRSLWRRRIIVGSDERGVDHEGGCSGEWGRRQVVAMSLPTVNELGVVVRYTEQQLGAALVRTGGRWSSPSDHMCERTAKASLLH